MRVGSDNVSYGDGHGSKKGRAVAWLGRQIFLRARVVTRLRDKSIRDSTRGARIE